MRFSNIVSTFLLAAPAWASTRGMWFWEAEKLQNQNEVNDLIRWAEQYKISVLYTQVNRDVSTAAYESFISKCSEKGIAVQALMGDNTWATNEGFPNVDKTLTWVDEYQKEVNAKSRFSAIHFDVEPWVRTDWEENKASLTTGLLRVAEAINKTAVEKMNNLDIETDIAFWADEIDCPGYGVNLSQWMLRRMTATHFMTYRNSPDAMLAERIAGRSLERGDGEGKPVWLSIETVNTGDDIQSYYGSTLQHFLSDLSIIEQRASKHPSYAGMGIHYYEGMKALRT